MTGDHPMKPLVAAWMSKIRLAWDVKKKKFQDDADEAMAFFSGPYDWMYGLKSAASSRSFAYSGNDGDLPRPTFCMTVNKVAELVQLFGPVLYHKNPVRQVNPRRLPMLPVKLFGDLQDPNAQMLHQQMLAQVEQERAVDEARAKLIEHYLNWTPTAMDLKTESRWAIDEAIIKGMGVLWTDLYQPAGSMVRMVGSFYDTVDNLVIDPDMESIQSAQWVARRCTHPYWQVEEDYGFAPGSLKQYASMESYGKQSQLQLDANADYRRKQGTTNDLMVYWKVWSKMGLGGRLSGVKPDLEQQTAAMGKFCHLVLCESCPFPLNVPPEVSQMAMGDDPLMQVEGQQRLTQAVQWQTPFWADDAWPFRALVFHPVPREVWPMNHIKPAMGELKFLNWAYSFLAGKVKTASRDFIAIAKSAGEEVKQQIQTGTDYTIVEVEALHGSIDKVVQFLQHPGFNGEIYRVIEGVMQMFERRTGLTELLYGQSSRQYRSAAEAEIKGEQVNIRPDEMANQVEDWMTDLARSEALSARWHLTPEDVLPVMGQMGSQWWAQFVMPTDPSLIVHQLEYRIEAGSARKPNKSREASNMQSAVQMLFTPLWQYAMTTGNVSPVNALIVAWAQSIDLDPQPFLIQPPPPPPPPMPALPPEQPGQPVEGQAA